MEQITFSKYHGTGNDFIIINDKNLVQNSVLYNEECKARIISRLTKRNFGIGADGIIIIKAVPHESRNNSVDFEMKYYNPDGSQSLCGNGSRCAVKYAYHTGIIKNKDCTFKAYDGIHEASIVDKNIRLKMSDVTTVQNYGEDYFVDTGAPHHIVWVEDTNINVEKEGRTICNSDKYAPIGTNVNFVSYSGDNQLKIRTYEKGVNRETFSCGTGVTASAIAASEKYKINNHVIVETQGGGLEVKFQQIKKQVYSSIYLIGPAEKVYEGVIKIK